ANRDSLALASHVRGGTVRCDLSLTTAAMRRVAIERPDFVEAATGRPPTVRADGGAEVGHRNGRVHDLRRTVLRLVQHCEGFVYIRSDGHLHPRMPCPAGGPD